MNKYKIKLLIAVAILSISSCTSNATPSASFKSTIVETKIIPEESKKIIVENSKTIEETTIAEFVEPASDEYSIVLDTYVLSNLDGTSYDDYKFDEYGRVISRTKRIGHKTYTYDYKYDEKGALLSANRYSISYNDNGLVSAIVLDDFASEYEYNYNSDGTVKSIINYFHYLDTGERFKSNITEYEWINDNQILNKTSFYSYKDGTITSTSLNEQYYDDENRIYRMDCYNDEIYTREYKYKRCNYIISSKNNNTLLSKKQWEYFDECAAIPTINSCLSNTELISIDDNNDAIIYTFKIPDTKSTNLQGTSFSAALLKTLCSADAELLDISNSVGCNDFIKYQQILSQIAGLKVESEKNIVYISNDETLVAIMSAGIDSEIGTFVSISFPNY